VRLHLRGGAFAFEVVRSAAAAAAATASKTLFMIKACTCFKAASRRNTHLDEPSVLAGIGQAGNSKIRLAASLRRAGLFL